MAKDQRFIKGENLVLSGVPVKWAYLFDPDTKYEPKWSVDAYLSEEDATEMKSLGFNIKDSPDGPLIKLTKKCTTKAGKKLAPPKVVGLDPRVPFTQEVGNGSVCNVMVYAVYRTVNGNEILCAYLEGVQVVDHVEYSGSGGGFDNLSE